MKSWWELGEWEGAHGSDLALYSIVCAFCGESGNFKPAFHKEKKKPNSDKRLNFDVYECCNCAGFVHVLWSASSFGGGLHDFRVLPWPIGKPQAPEHWPANIKRYWVQAHDTATSENWDASALMARSALQRAVRDHGAKGGSLRAEIDDLASRGDLPVHMKEWAHELRLLANESAHPDDSEGVTPNQKDVTDILSFLDFLLVYLYNLPHEIAEYRKRRDASAS
jgi:hypothetical protein